MNIIFLDVDGVLNSIRHLIEVYNQTHKQHSGYSYPFDEECLSNLKKLVNETNSKIVVISTWRKDIKGKKILMQKLKEYSLDKEVIGYTPDLNKPRRAEIKAFLDNLNRKPKFIILDDNLTDMEDLLPYSIEINAQYGLTKENIEEAINKLNKQHIKWNEEMER